MLRILSVAILASACLAACAQQTPTTREQLVERGEYLVNNVVLCGDCHTPMGPQGPDQAHKLQGGPNLSTPTIQMPWATVVPSIAGIPENYSEDQFITFLQTGVRPDGSHPLPPMPPYRLDDADARAVAAYISTVPRASN